VEFLAAIASIIPHPACTASATTVCGRPTPGSASAWWPQVLSGVASNRTCSRSVPPSGSRCRVG
jgi:hypothetical protein